MINQEVREQCCECSVTIEDLLDVYEYEPVKRLFICVNHGADIVCFLCFHSEKNKKLFKCKCSTIEHWVHLPCGQPMLSHKTIQSQITSQIAHDKAGNDAQDGGPGHFS